MKAINSGSPVTFEETIPTKRVLKLLQLLSPKALSNLSTKIFGEGSEERKVLEGGSPSNKEDMVSNIMDYIVHNEIVETPKRKGVKDALFGKGEFTVNRFENWHNHYTTVKGDAILDTIKERIKEFVADRDVEGFHVGKCTADSAKEAVYNRWNTTYSRGYSGMIVIYEDTQNSTLAEKNWRTRQDRQIRYEKKLHRAFNTHEKWIPQSTERTGSIVLEPKKSFCLYLAYRSSDMGVIDWSPATDTPITRYNSRDSGTGVRALDSQQPSQFSRPAPTSPTRFAAKSLVPHTTSASITGSTTQAVPASRPSTTQTASPVNKELKYDATSVTRAVSVPAGPRGLVGYEGSIADLKDRFDKEDIKRCKLKLLTGELSGQIVVITRFNGSSTYVQTVSGDTKTPSTSNRVIVVSYG